MLLLAAIVLALIIAIYFFDSITSFIGNFILLFVIEFLILNIIASFTFSDIKNQEMITTENSITSFIDNKDDPIYVKYSFKWNGGSTYRYVKQNGKYPEYKEISVSKDVNIVEGNYKPVLITHSYKANENYGFLFGPIAKWFLHDSWYEFYIPEGTFITY